MCLTRALRPAGWRNLGGGAVGRLGQPEPLALEGGGGQGEALAAVVAVQALPVHGLAGCPAGRDFRGRKPRRVDGRAVAAPGRTLGDGRPVAGEE